MKFPIFFLVLCFVAVAVAKFTCTDGVPYMENDCNTCACRNGILSCHLTLCPTAKSIKLSKCKAGTEWKYKCNDCVCDPVMKTICTDYPC